MNSRGDVRIYICRNAVYGSEVMSWLANIRLEGDVAVEAVPCGGRIDPRYILKALEGGARAVVVLACPTGQCKSMEGNLRAVRRVNAVRDLLAEAGLDADSVQVYLPTNCENGALDAAMQTITRFLGDEERPKQEMVA